MKHHNSSSNTADIIVGIGVLLVALVIIVFSALKCSANFVGSNQSKAEQEAKAFIGDSYPGATVSCSGGDSDGDGYVSCSILPGKDDHRAPFSIQCVAAYSMMSSGCKITNALMPQFNQSR